MMGGVQVDGDTQMSTVPGLFAAGECARGIARSQSAGRKFAFRLAGVRQARRRISPRSSPRKTARARFTRHEVEAAAKKALAPFERGAAGENPFAIQHELQDDDAEAGGHRARRKRDAAGAGR